MMKRIGIVFGALLCLLLSGCIRLRSSAASREQAAPAMAERAEAQGPRGRTYTDVLSGLLRRWGSGAGAERENGGCQMTGLWLVRLLDLNRDGVQELLIRYGAETPDAVDRAEIWTIADGCARRLYIGVGRMEESGPCLAFYEIGGEWQLCTGSLGARTALSVYGLREGRLEHLHSLSGGDGTEPPLVDGTPVSEAELDATLRIWEQSVLRCAAPSGPEELEQVLGQTEQTLSRFLPAARGRMGRENLTP